MISKFKGEGRVERGPGHKPPGRSSTNRVRAGLRRPRFDPIETCKLVGLGRYAKEGCLATGSWEIC